MGKNSYVGGYAVGACSTRGSSSSTAAGAQQQLRGYNRKKHPFDKEGQNIPAGGHTVRMRPCGARLPHEAYIRTNVNACTLCRPGAAPLAAGLVAELSHFSGKFLGSVWEALQYMMLV